MKKFILFTIVLIFIVSLCSCTENEKSNNSVAVSNNSSIPTSDAKSTESPTVTPNETIKEDPDMPYFMHNVGAVKNSNGTYSFDGHFTKCTTSIYSSDVSVHIKSVNGNGFSSGDSFFRHQTYVRKSGELGAIVADLMYNPSEIINEFFRFTYDKDGELVSLVQLR